MAPEGQRYCKECISLGHNNCLAAEGSQLCVYCRDGEACPVTEARLARAQAANISGKAAKVVQAKDVKKEEEKTMNEPRICSREGCGAKLRSNNTTGRCSAHFYVPKGEKKSGAASSTPASTEKSVTPRKPKAAKKDDGPKIPKAIARAAAAAAVCATIQVTEAALDSWWTKLDVQGKADAFTNAMVIG